MGHHYSSSLLWCGSDPGISQSRHPPAEGETANTEGAVNARANAKGIAVANSAQSRQPSHRRKRGRGRIALASSWKCDRKKHVQQYMTDREEACVISAAYRRQQCLA